MDEQYDNSLKNQAVNVVFTKSTVIFTEWILEPWVGFFQWFDHILYNYKINFFGYFHHPPSPAKNNNWYGGNILTLAQNGTDCEVCNILLLAFVQSTSLLYTTYVGSITI